MAPLRLCARQPIADLQDPSSDQKTDGPAGAMPASRRAEYRKFLKAISDEYSTYIALEKTSDGTATATVARPDVGRSRPASSFATVLPSSDPDSAASAIAAARL